MSCSGMIRIQDRIAISADGDTSPFACSTQESLTICVLIFPGNTQLRAQTVASLTPQTYFSEVYQRSGCLYCIHVGSISYGPPDCLPRMLFLHIQCSFYLPPYGIPRIFAGHIMESTRGTSNVTHPSTSHEPDDLPDCQSSHSCARSTRLQILRSH